MSQMLKSSGALAAATMASRVLGLVREMIYARFMGAGWVADAFTLAFMVPNLFRRLLGEGALTAAFIPIFKSQEKAEGEPAMWRSANAVICGLVLVLAGLTLVALVGVTLVLEVTEPEGKTRLMLALVRVMFPYVLLVCVAAFITGLLNARGRFFIPALGSTLLNVVLILSVLWLAPKMGLELHEQIFGVAIGVLVAGVLQVAFQWPLLRREQFRLQWVPPWQHPVVRRVLSQMIPGIVGVAAYQINVLLTNSLAFWVEDAIVASFNYAVRLLELPQGVFGLSLAAFLLPTLSSLAADKDYPGFRETLSRGIGYLVLINLLASVLLFVLAEPIIRLLFERGRFDVHDTSRTSLALMCLAPGLVAYSAVTVLARGFYALGDIRTPVRISLFSLSLNAVLALLLIWRFREAGLGAANSASAVLQAALLTYALRRKIGHLDWSVLGRFLPGLVGATLVAGAAAFGIKELIDNYLDHTTLLGRSAEVFIPMLGASALYMGVCGWLKVPYLFDIKGLWGGKDPSGT